MDTIVTISQFLLSLSLLIILHEMGHFLPAKWFKTRVEKFFLFFDFAPFNALWSIKRGGTEYGIGWLPLGGYVKIAGMVDESMDTEALKAPPQPWEFRSKKAWQRLIIMIGGVTVNFLLGFFIFAMMLWHWGKAYVPTDKLTDGIAFDSVLIRQGLRNGDLILKVGNNNFDRLDPAAFREAIILNNVNTLTIRRDGQVMTLRLPDDAAKQLSAAKIAKDILMSPRIPFYVAALAPGKPAEKAGIKKGDRIIAFNDAPTTYYDQFTLQAMQHKGEAVTLKMLRNSDTITTKLTLTDDGKLGVQTQTDSIIPVEYQKYTLAAALPGGVEAGVDFLSTQLKAFGQMFRGKIKVQDNLGSVISIGKLFGTNWVWERFWSLTASLSILLAFMNLLPIPALDGGYVMFLIWEVITGKKVSDKFMEKAVTIGFFLLIGLMVYALGLDVWRNFLQKLF